MNHDYLGAQIKKLGFGLLRMPMIGTEIDVAKVADMVDLYLARGFTYFDTGHSYFGGRSEAAAKIALFERYPRESFQFATKIPATMIKEPGDFERELHNGLARCGTDYFDFYMLHNLCGGYIDDFERMGAWKDLVRMKEQGLLRHIGFSYHDSAENLDKILTRHPEAEFVQLQINYVDWTNEIIQSGACYEVAKRHGKPVTIMEPIKGGSLASLPDEAKALLNEADPGASVASWALRFAASLPGLITVLSGMSTVEQVDENTKLMLNFKPLTDEERALLDAVVKIVQAQPAIPCSACHYCTKECPKHIDIPRAIELLNRFKTYHTKVGAIDRYRIMIRDQESPDRCIRCGQCERQCPQHLSIMDIMAEAVEVFGK